MFKYTNALIWRTKTQIERTIRIVDIVTLFSGVLIPLFMLIMGGGVWVRNLIFLICGLGLASFALVQEITKQKASKKESDSIQLWIKVIRIVADAYALFLLGYGVFGASKDPSLMTVLPLVPVGLSLLWNLIMLIGKILVDKIFELVWDAVELDTKPVMETVKKTQQLWHLVKGDGVEVETHIEVSEHNKEILDKTLVRFKAAIAAEKTKKQLIKQQQQAMRTQTVVDLARGFASVLKRKKAVSELGEVIPEVEEAVPMLGEAAPIAEFPAPSEESVTEIAASKKKNPLAFLSAIKKKAPEQIAEHSEENVAEEEAVSKP